VRPTRDAKRVPDPAHSEFAGSITEIECDHMTGAQLAKLLVRAQQVSRGAPQG
jgi:hypothetical protein